MLPVGPKLTFSIPAPSVFAPMAPAIILIIKLIGPAHTACRCTLADAGSISTEHRQLSEMIGQQVIDSNPVLCSVAFHFIADRLDRLIQLGVR